MFNRHKDETSSEKREREARTNRRLRTANKLIYGTIAITVIVYVASYVGTTAAIVNALETIADVAKEVSDEAEASIAA